MAEVKNAFVKSRMNLDTEARLLPNGEYREGFNIQVSKSEGADVGALENVLGNSLLQNFTTLTSNNDLQIIGQFTDTDGDNIFVFLTDFTDSTHLTNPQYNPNSANYIYAYNVLTMQATLLVQGSFLNFSTTNTILGINLLEDLLFFTDNRNQPRKINIQLAIDNPGYYTNEDQISVSKFSPYESILLYKQTSTTGLSGYETTMYDVVSEYLPGTTTDNPYRQGSVQNGNFVSTYPGDADYLESKFVRFSYRFRFDDNEYSTFAPFTQAAFIPKQDGYFLNDDENNAYRTTVLSNFENKVNEIKLQIPLPTTGNNLFSSLKVTEIDILYKEDDDTTVQVLDTITQANFGTSNTLEFTYQGTKPYKTLPERELIRVYDKVPVRALSQEVVSNRVVYGNFQDKHTPPSSLNYNVQAGDKYNFDLPSSDEPVGNTSIIEYPNSTLKQNRNYQVGVVLSDRYGRSSSVILSDNQTQQIFDNLAFDVSTVYHNYRDSTLATAAPINTWPGDSLKVLFNSPINSTKFLASGEPGLYNGDPSSSNYNPLGWYSFKIVVKQFEQEYYNVYLPGILKTYPTNTTGQDPADTVGFITLINDNINKVPRDLSEVGPEQKQFRSSVELFGRITPDSTNAYNTQYYPGDIVANPHTVVTVAEQNDLFDLSTNTADDIYETKSNPLVGRISQLPSNVIGSVNFTNNNFKLGVFETSPVESRLNIYYETSTSGIVSELNTAILTGDVNLPTDLYNFVFTLNEGMTIGTDVATAFAVKSTASGNNPVTNSNLVLKKVINGLGEVIQVGNTGVFNFIDNGKSGQTYDNYTLQTGELFYYGSTSNVKDQYTFYFDNDGTELTARGSLTNVAPTISPKPTQIQASVGDTTINVNNANFSSVNGSADTSTPSGQSLPINKQELFYTITYQSSNNNFTINSTTGQINVTGNPSGVFNVTITVTDGGGLTDTFTTDLVFGVSSLNAGFGTGINFNANEYLNSQGGSSLAIYWTSNETNSVNTGNETVDRTFGGYSTNALQMNATLPDASATTSYTETKTVNVTQPTNLQAIQLKNSNYNALGSAPAGTTQQDAALSKGTAYIYIRYTLQNDAFFVNQQNTATGLGAYAMLPVVLQFREAGSASSNWVTATDIEGREIRFGSTNYNLYSLYTQQYPLSQQSTLREYGLLNYADKAINFFSNYVNDPPVSNAVSDQQCMQSFVSLPSQTQQDFIFSRNQYVVAIGDPARQNNNQTYSGVSAKYGDYRLIVRYPWGRTSDNSNLITIGNPNSNVVGGQFPGNNYTNLSMFDFDIDWGDFYYPYGQSDTYYAYKFYTNGQNSPHLASGQVASGYSLTVYAREWAPRYVTQFYTNAELTNKLTISNWSPSTAWFAYTPLNDTSQVAQKGTNYSSVLTSGQTNFQQNQYRNSDRIWMAFFDNTGLKQKATAIPSATGSMVVNW